MIIDKDLHARALKGGKWITVTGECSDDELILIQITRDLPVYMKSGVGHKAYVFPGMVVNATIISTDEAKAMRVTKDD